MRYRNERWNVGEKNEYGGVTWDQLKASVLMDLRDELQRLNGIIGCHNFIAIPSTLRSIKRNTTPKKVVEATAKARFRMASRRAARRRLEKR